MNNRNNMDTGSLLKKSWVQSWPVVIIMFAEFLLGIVDVYVAGRISKEVQAAYGFVFQIYFVFLVLATAATVGAVALISKIYTSENRKDYGETIFTSLVTVFIAGIIVSVIGNIFSGSLIKVPGLEKGILVIAASLFGIYSLSLLPHFMLINTNGILRATERVKYSLRTMLIVCSINLPLNFYLSLHTKLGYKGIAVATLISISFGAILNITKVLSEKGIIQNYRKDMMVKMLNTGWPIGVLQAAWQSGVAVLFFIISGLPAHNVEIMAAFTNGLRIESVIFLPAFAFNLSNAVIVGNHLGSEDTHSAFKNGIATALIGIIVVTVLSVIVFIKADAVSSILTDNDVVRQECARYLRITLVVEPFMACGVILGGALSGAGDTRTVLKIVASSFWAVRLPLAYIFGIIFGYGAFAIWIAMNISVVLQSSLVIRRYFSRRWIRVAYDQMQ